MRYLITPEPAQICETVYLPASIVDTAFTDASLADDAFINDAFARNDAAQAAQAAPAGGGQAAPAVGVPVHLADAAPQVAQPAAQPAVQPAAQPPVVQQQANHAAPRLANVQQPPQQVLLPWTGEPGDFSLMDRLCDKLSAADLASLERWDQLARALSLAAPPSYIFQPPDDVMARVEYINQRLADLEATYDIRLAPTLAPGWPAVFSCARLMMRPTSGSSVIQAPVANNLSSSFSMRVQNHSYAASSRGPASSLPAETAGSSTLAFSAAVAAAASRVEGDRSGSADAHSRALLGAQVSGPEPLASVQRLGELMTNLPRDLQILDAADGHFYNSANSAQLHAISLALTASTSNFYQHAAGSLRMRIGSDDLINPPPQRKTDTEKVLQLMQRGKIHTASELMLMGTGGSDLLSAFKEVPMTDSLFLRGQSILQVLSFAYKLFDTSASKNFFEEAEERMRGWRRDKRDIPRAATLLECLLRDLSIEFRNFFDGHPSASLMRPRYLSTAFTSATAALLIDKFEREPVHTHLASAQPQLSQQQIADAVSASVPAAVAAFLAMGTPQAATPAVAAGTGKKKKKAKKEAAPPAPVVPPGYPPGVPPGHPPGAAPHHEAFNLAGIIGGAPHVGASTPQEMAAFSAANMDATGKGRCFNFWRRGTCRNPNCRFSHV